MVHVKKIQTFLTTICSECCSLHVYFQVGLARWQQSDLCGLRVKLPPVTTSPTTQW